MSSDDSEHTDEQNRPQEGVPGEDAPGDDAGLLDSLLKAFDDRERRAAESQGGGSAHDPYDDSDYAWSRSSGGDLSDSDETEADAFPEPRITATDPDSDIDALIKIAIDSSGEDDDSGDVDEDARVQDSATVLDEGEIDESLFDELSDAAEGDDSALSTADDDDTELVSAAEGEVGESEAPVEERAEEETAVAPDESVDPVAAEIAETADAEPADSDDWLTDLKPEEPLAEQPESLDAVDVAAPESEPATDMDEVLATVEGADAEAPASFDALFEDPPAAEEAVDEFAAVEAGESRPEAELESVNDSTVIEEIGSENVAAGAAADAATPAPPPKEKKAPAPVASEAPTEPAPVRTRPVWLPPSPADIFRAQPKRAAAALAAGVLVGVATFVYLAANRYRAPESVVSSATAMPLERAMRLSQAMMDDRDYAGALGVLDSALAAASKTDERYADALFQRLDAKMDLLPAMSTRADADAMHTAIDEAVREGRQHRRTSEALMWKAEVYEREGNVAAARAEYRGILEDYGNAPNRDEVLLRLGQLELRTERPLEAIQIARQVMADYPRSSFLPQARLLLGDASEAAGDRDGARVAYIHLAEEKMDSPIGAEAFERLGKIALDEGKPATAIREMQSRLRSATTVEGNERVYLVLARAHRASGEPDEARNILNELIDFFPESDVTPSALVELSQVLVDLGLAQEAVRLAERTIERYPEHAAALQNAAALYASGGDHQKAGDTYLRAYAAGAASADVLLAAGREFDRSGESDDAQESFQRVVTEYPATPEAIEAQIGWARAALAMGDVNGAYIRLNEVATVTEGRPRQLPVLRALAELYGQLGLQRDMIATYGKVAGITDEPAALAEAAQRLMDANAVDAGLAIARRVEIARLEPGQGYPFLQAWGRTMLRGDAELAIDLLQRAHDDYPEQRTSAGVETLMRAVIARGRTAQARAILSEMQARAEATRDPGDRAWLASAAARYGDFLSARNDYAAAAEAYAMASAKPGRADDAPMPSETEYWNAYQRANALFALGRFDESLALYDLVGKSAARVARDARARADAARLEQRRAEGPAAAAETGG